MLERWWSLCGRRDGQSGLVIVVGRGRGVERGESFGFGGGMWMSGRD